MSAAGRGRGRDGPFSPSIGSFGRGMPPRAFDASYYSNNIRNAPAFPVSFPSFHASPSSPSSSSSSSSSSFSPPLPPNSPPLDAHALSPSVASASSPPPIAPITRFKPPFKEAVKIFTGPEWDHEIYGDEVLVHPLKHSLTCLLCLSVAFRAVNHFSKSCSALFCENCITKNIVDWKRSACPFCQSDPVTISDFVPNVSIRHVVAELDVKCVTNGCEWQGKAADFISHTESCPYTLSQCQFKQNGCTFTPIKKEIESHASECDYRPVSLDCLCGGTLLFKDWAHHLDVLCPHAESSCNQCHAVLKRKNIASHAEICPQRVLDCKFKPLGCPEQLKLVTRSLHEDTCLYGKLNEYQQKASEQISDLKKSTVYLSNISSKNGHDFAELKQEMQKQLKSVAVEPLSSLMKQIVDYKAKQSEQDKLIGQEVAKVDRIYGERTQKLEEENKQLRSELTELKRQFSQFALQFSEFQQGNANRISASASPSPAAAAAASVVDAEPDLLFPLLKEIGITFAESDLASIVASMPNKEDVSLHLQRALDAAKSSDNAPARTPSFGAMKSLESLANAMYGGLQDQQDEGEDKGSDSDSDSSLPPLEPVPGFDPDAFSEEEPQPQRDEDYGRHLRQMAEDVKSGKLHMAALTVTGLKK